MSAKFRMPALFAALLAVSGPHAAADEIYRWTDADGLVHFSDTRPAEVDDIESLYVGATNPPGYDPASDPYSITNQAARIGETWSRLEEERDTRRASRQEPVARAPQFVYEPWTSYYPYRYYGPVSGPPLRPPARPGYRPPPSGPTLRRQVAVMDELGLSGDRPHSINSGRHQARVERSAGFVDAIRRAPPGPVPHRPPPMKP